MLLDHSLGKDVTIVSEKGEGKTMLMKMFSHLLGYKGSSLRVVQLFKEMSSRDLFQRRIINEKGDTLWELSPICQAALEGGLVILDGLEKIRPESLSVLQRLLQDREYDLYDGSRLLRWDRYDFILKKKGKEWMEAKKMKRVSESFRVIASCCPPKSKKEWLSSEILSIFSFHHLPPVLDSQKEQIALKQFPEIDIKLLSALSVFQAKISSFCQEQKKVSPSLSFSPLSTRQFLRICKRIEKYPGDLYDCVHRTFLSNFLPATVRESLENFIKESGIEKSLDSKVKNELIVDKEKQELRIGEVSAKILRPKNEALVPNVLFYEIPKHTLILKEILKDIVLRVKPLIFIL